MSKSTRTKLTKKIRKSNKKQINCYMCGRSGKISLHHVIPKKLKPKENTLIPLCMDCHKKIHSSKIIPSFKFEDTLLTDNIKFIPYLKLYIKVKNLERLNKNLNNSNSFLTREINSMRKNRDIGERRNGKNTI